jgi:hypothetical protein
VRSHLLGIVQPAAVAGLLALILPSSALAWGIWTPSHNILYGIEDDAVACQIMHQAVASSPSYCEGVYSFVGVVRRRGSATLSRGCYTGVPFAVESPRTSLRS